jgi:hypothetical protein
MKKILIKEQNTSTTGFSDAPVKVETKSENKNPILISAVNACNIPIGPKGYQWSKYENNEDYLVKYVDNSKDLQKRIYVNKNNQLQISIDEYDGTPEKNIVSKKSLLWECNNKLAPYVAAPINTQQDDYMNRYVDAHMIYTKTRPLGANANEYERLDMNSIKDDDEAQKLFTTPGIHFLYKHKGLTNLTPDQTEKINKFITNLNLTLTVPDAGTKEYAAGKPAYDTLRDLKVGNNILELIQDIDKHRLKSSIPDQRKKLMVYPIKDTRNSNTRSKDVNQLNNEIKSQIKNSKIDKGVCRKTIKFLFNSAKANNEKGLPTTIIEPYDLANQKKYAKSCSTQGTTFLSGPFGVKDELDFLENCRNGWCLRGMNENKSNLGTLIRENLLEIKEKKNKSILSEGKIVKGRLSIISENVILKTNKQKDKFFGDLLSEMVYLNSQGFNKEIINEGFFDVITGLLGHAPEGIMEYFKEYIGKWLVKHLTPADENGWIGNMIITGIGNLDISEIPKLTDCNFLTKWISKSAAEGTVRKLTHEKGLDGPFYDVLRNSIIDMMDKSALGSKIEEGLGGIICPLLGGVKNKMDAATDKLKEKALAK